MTIVHRDIKPENIIYKNQNNMLWDNLEIKLIDFGFAKISQNNHDLNEFLGTPYYMAPEIVKMINMVLNVIFGV